MDTSLNCVICLKSLNMEDGVLTPCQHRYHSHCFFTWIYNNKTCPLCRKVLIRNVSYDEEANLRELRQQINWESVVYETLLNNSKAKEREIKEKNCEIKELNQKIKENKQELIYIQQLVMRKNSQVNSIIERYKRFIYSLKRKNRHGLLF